MESHRRPLRRLDSELPWMKSLVPRLSLALLLAASPITAGTLLVPVPEPALAAASTRSVRLTFSNVGQVARRATPVFIPAGADGTGPARVVGSSITIDPGKTVEVEGLAPGAGMLELIVAPQLVVRARLLLRDPLGAIVSESGIPITAGDSVEAADASADLLDLSRGGGRLSDLVLANVDKEDQATCTVTTITSSGATIASATHVVARYSAISVGDLLAGTNASAVRARVSCDRRWHGWAIVTDLSRGAHRVVGPPATGQSTLLEPGASSCAVGAICLEIPGVFHTATNGAANFTTNVPVAPGRTFSRMRLDFDLVPGPWYGPEPDANHNLFWIHRGRFTPPATYAPYDTNVFGALNALGNRNRFRLVTNIDMAPGDHTFDVQSGVLEQGVRYHVTYEINGATRRADFVVTRDGATVGAVSTTVGGPVASGSADAFMLYFGHALPTVAPWIGTTWSDLHFEAVP